MLVVPYEHLYEDDIVACSSVDALFVTLIWDYHLVASSDEYSFFLSRVPNE